MAESTLILKIEGAQAKRAADSLRRSLTQLESQGEETSESFEQMNDKMDRSEGIMGRLRGVAGALAGALAVREYVQAADTMTNLNNQLALVTDSAEELTEVQEALYDISQRSFASFESTTTLYARMARATQDLGVSNELLLTVTQGINDAFRISGASAQEASGAIVQLSQALASGTFRGDEFNSVMEQAPEIGRAVAESLGVTIGELRELAADGQLTTDVLLKAILEASEGWREAADGMGVTFEQAMTNVRNSFVNMVGTIEENTGIIEGFAEMMNELSKSFDNILPAAMQVATLALIKLREEFARFISQLAGWYANLTSAFGLFENDLSRTLETAAENWRLTAEGYTAQYNHTLQNMSDAQENLRRALQGTSDDAEGAGTSIQTLKDELNGLTGSTDEATAATTKLNRELDSLESRYRRRTESPEDALFREISDIERLRSHGRINEEEFADMMGAVYDTYDETLSRMDGRVTEWGDHWGNEQEKIKRGTQTMANDFGRMVGGMLSRGEFDFEQFASFAISKLAEIATQGFFGGGGGGGGGLFGFASGTDFVPASGPALLHRGEAVLNRQEAERYRRGEGMAAAPVTVQIINTGTPQRATSQESQVDATGIITKIMVDDLTKGGQVSNAMERTFGVRRG